MIDNRRWAAAASGVITDLANARERVTLLLTELGMCCREHRSVLSIAVQNRHFKARWKLLSVFRDKTGISGHGLLAWLSLQCWEHTLS